MILRYEVGYVKFLVITSERRVLLFFVHSTCFKYALCKWRWNIISFTFTLRIKKMLSLQKILIPTINPTPLTQQSKYKEWSGTHCKSRKCIWMVARALRLMSQVVVYDASKLHASSRLVASRQWSYLLLLGETCVALSLITEMGPTLTLKPRSINRDDSLLESVGRDDT